MGYVERLALLDCYTPSDAVIISNDAEKTAISASYVKVKQITVVRSIYPGSQFRYTYDIKSTDGTHAAYGHIYKNGVAIGSQGVNNNGIYETDVEDIVTTNWLVGDTIELWCRSTGGKAYWVKNFRIEGVGAPFYGSLV